MVDVHVKERLTGAIILVALVVLLVPELLSGSGRPAPTARAADPGVPMRSYTIDLANEAGAQHRAPASPVAASAPRTEPAPAPVQSAARPADASSPDADGADATGSSAADRHDRSTETPAPASPSVGPSHSRPTAGASTLVPASPSSSGSAGAPARGVHPASSPKAPSARAATPTAPPVAGWMIQLGSFASRDNAERLARELRGKGFPTSVNESAGNGRRRYRVRVGPEADRPAALVLATKLRAAGHSGSLVPP
jgi:DedD protein